MEISIEKTIEIFQGMKKGISPWYPEEYYNFAISIMRKYQKLEQEPTTKNDLGVDAISRADVLKLMKDNWHNHNGDWAMQESMDDIRALPSVTPQEPFKLMAEIDLYSVIKQKYIEREVLDKIREQIKSNLRGVEIALEVLVENDPLRPKTEGAKDTLEDCLELIDKAESEPQESEDT